MPVAMRSLKGRLVMILALFSIAFSTVFCVCLIYHVRGNLQKAQEESIQYELKNASTILSECMNSISQILYYASSDADVLRLLSSFDGTLAISINKALRDKITFSSLDPYISKLMLIGRDRVCVTVGQTNGLPSDFDKFQALPLRAQITATDSFGWAGIYPEMFNYGNISRDVIPFVREIKGYGHDIIGHVYISLNPSMIIDQIQNYSALREGVFLIRIGDRFYRMQDSSFIEVNVTVDLTSGFATTGMTSGTLTIDGALGKAIISNLNKGWSLIQITPPVSMLHASDVWFIVLVAVLSIVVLSVLLFQVMSSLVTVPVGRLQRQFVLDENNQDLLHIRDLLHHSSSEFIDISDGIEGMRARLNDMMRQEIMHEKEKRKLEFRVLQYQINPHFIGNTLNTIKWMADMQQSPGISELAAALHDLFQMLIRTEDATISLDCVVNRDMI